MDAVVPPSPGHQAHRTMLSAIIESSYDAIVSKDLDGIVTSWNQAAERIFGYTAAEMVGKPIVLLVPADRPNEEPEILERLRRGERVEHFETVRRRKDGTLIDVSVTISPIRDEQGVVVGASKIARDITEQKRLQRELEAFSSRVREQNEELERRNEALAEADRQKNEFLAMLAHELRNPLAPIISSTYLLRMNPAGRAGSPELLEVIERQVRHMSRLLNDLLDVSRVNRGKIPLERELLEFGLLVRDAVQDLGMLFEERGQKLSLEGVTEGANEDLLVRGDAVRLHQVVNNLLSNAIKFTEPGGSIHVEVAREGAEAVLRVKDTGVGIAPELLPQVFDLFIQADQGLARSQGGLGIGLTMVKHLVELHEGHVEAHSEGLGHGTEFVVRLPVYCPEESASIPTDGEGALPNDVKTRERKTEGFRILVVDDNEDSAETLAELASLWGYTSFTAHDGHTAVEKARAECPDVVLLDIGMPGMNGYAVAEAIRKLNGEVRLVAVSGYGNTEDLRRAREAGFDAHLVKPVEPDTVRRLLAGIREA